MTRNEVVKLRERLQSCSEEMKVLKNNTKSEVSRSAVGLKPGMSRCGVKDESLHHRCNVRDESLPHRCKSSRCCDVRDKSSSHSRLRRQCCTCLSAATLPVYYVIVAGARLRVPHGAERERETGLTGRDKHTAGTHRHTATRLRQVSLSYVTCDVSKLVFSPILSPTCVGCSCGLICHAVMCRYLEERRTHTTVVHKLEADLKAAKQKSADAENEAKELKSKYSEEQGEWKQLHVSTARSRASGSSYM